ncbi:hypothetical protein Aab01nite_53510 [Paractinoplanes abujensis]|nr:hypothetical protein Aab01nite_53510 [Actinoplanes abujensis]
MPVAQLLSRHPDLVRDLQHQRVRIPQPPLPSRIRILQNPPSRRRIIRPLQQHPQLVRSAKNVRIILGKVNFPQLNRLLKQRPSPRDIPRRGQGVSSLPSGTKG